LLWWQLVDSWASWPAARADGWHSKLGHRVLCARISGAFCCSGHPDHGGGILGPSAATQPDGWHSCLGQSPFASLCPLTVRTISANGCGQQASSHRQPEMAQQASGWQTTVRSVTCRTVQPRVTSIRCDGGWDHGLHSEQIVGIASLGTDSCVRACPGLPAGQARKAGHGAGRWLAQPLGAQSPVTSLRPLTVGTFFAHGCG
jgi:hypothetical protein